MSWNYSFKQGPPGRQPYFNPRVTALKKIKETANGKKREEIAAFITHSQNNGVASNTAHLFPANAAWHQVRDYIRDPTETKVIYVTRHGHSTHNGKAEKYGKGVYYEFFAKDSQDVDPSLDAKGVTEAEGVGKVLADLSKHGLPLPKSYYSSPLRRCIQTAIHVNKALYGKSKAPDTIHVKDGLREWIGWDHNHSSDMRSPKQEMKAMATMIGGNIDYPTPQENDPWVPNFASKKNLKFDRKEAYADVRKRIEETLNGIFDNDTSKVIHLFLHNRCFRSFLRVIGHTEAEEIDMENCATIVFLVTRTKANAADKEKLYREQKVKEEKQIAEERNAVREEGKKTLNAQPRKVAAEWYMALTNEQDRKTFKEWYVVGLDYEKLDKGRKK